jgi:hypothetical protein
MENQDLMAPGSIEDPEEEVGAEGSEEAEEEAPRSYTPSGYSSSDERCEYCQHFKEFTSPSCGKHEFDAEPDGHCPQFEGRKEDSSGTTEESYGTLEDEEDEEEDEEIDEG